MEKAIPVGYLLANQVESFYWYPSEKTLCLSYTAYLGTFHVLEKMILDRAHHSFHPSEIRFTGFDANQLGPYDKQAALDDAIHLYNFLELGQAKNIVYHDPTRDKKNAEVMARLTTPVKKEEPIPEKELPPLVPRSRSWGLFVRFRI